MPPTDAPSPNRWRATVVLAGMAVATGCGADRAPDTPPARQTVRVEATALEAREVPRAFEAIGSIHPWVRVSPGTKIMGRLDRVTVREGDRVRRGQLLATLEKRDLEAAVEQSRATIALAEANLANSRSQFQRMTLLHGRGSVTDKSLEDATSAFRVGEAQLAQAQAGLAAAEVTLGYAAIVSPIAGRVTEKHVEAGDMAQPGMSLFTVEDTSRIKVIAQMPESDVVGLAPGDPARVRVDALDRNWSATVDRVLPAGDPMSRTFQVELVSLNPDGQLKSGMFARVFLERGTRVALVVPATAVVERGQLRGVFVIDDQQIAHLRWVRFGGDAQGPVEVISGLVGGERIVTAPPPGFADGTPVATR